VAAHRRVLVVGAQQPPAVATGYLNTYRHLISDLVVVTMAEPESGYRDLVDGIGGLVRPGVPVIATVLRPRPVVSVAGRRTAYFCTAPPAAHRRIAEHLRDEHGADVAYVSGSLADREALRVELDAVDADVYLVELKAAAVDVVAETALERGLDVVLAANDIRPLPGQPDLDAELHRLAEELRSVPA
jgi:cyclic 2,3-diphosphoglycerate synthetase